MISFAAKLLIATLALNVASVTAAPVPRAQVPSAVEARLVQREPEIEQPSLESRDTPVVVEQRDAGSTHRYPRRAYYEYYEKRSPDSVVAPASSSIKFARDGGRHHSKKCNCGNGIQMRSFISIVRRNDPCACGSQPPASPPSSMQQPPQPAQCSGPSCAGNMMGNPPPPMGMNGGSAMSCTVVPAGVRR